jgi:transposase
MKRVPDKSRAHESRLALPVRRDPKLEILREEGVLNPHPERVRDVLFIEHDFFDARDLVQVKYEMVRRVEVDGLSVSDAASAFGLSRPAFYQARESLRALGVAGLLPRKRGPHGGHKLSLTVVAFLERTRAEEPSLRAGDLVQRVEQHFGVGVHPRSIERALARQAKKGS